MVSLWDLLTVLCVAMPVGGALASARSMKLGRGGYLLGITTALVLGLGCALAMRRIGEVVAARSARYSASLQEWCFRALYFAAVLWLLFASLLGLWVTSALGRLMV